MATHTPRSLLWLLANGSQGFGLIELLASMPYGEVDHEAEAILLAQVRTAWTRGWQPIAAPPPGLPRLHRKGGRKADRPRDRGRPCVASPRRDRPAVEGPGREAAAPDRHQAATAG